MLSPRLGVRINLFADKLIVPGHVAWDVESGGDVVENADPVGESSKRIQPRQAGEAARPQPLPLLIQNLRRKVADPSQETAFAVGKLMRSASLSLLQRGVLAMRRGNGREGANGAERGEEHGMAERIVEWSTVHDSSCGSPKPGWVMGHQPS